VLLLAKFRHAERTAVVVQVVEHVGILVTAEPFVFPVKPQGLALPEERTNILFVFYASAVCIFGRVAAVIKTFRD